MVVILTESQVKNLINNITFRPIYNFLSFFRKFQTQIP
jgi:hypothetical protein